MSFLKIYRKFNLVIMFIFKILTHYFFDSWFSVTAAMVFMATNFLCHILLKEVFYGLNSSDSFDSSSYGCISTLGLQPELGLWA
jgi:hypothetical protein